MSVSLEQIDQEAREAILSGIPEVLPILPAKNVVVYPFSVVPLQIGLARSIKLVEDVMKGNRLIGIIAQRDPTIEEAGFGDLYPVGTVARISQLMRRPDGGLAIVVQGLERIRIVEPISSEPYLTARIELYPDIEIDTAETEALKRSALDKFREIVSLANYLPDDLAEIATRLEDSRQIAYLIAATLRLERDQRHEVLERTSVREKLQLLVDFMNRELEVLEIGKRIQTETQERISKAQREYILREQLRSIQRELGETEGKESEVESLRRRLEEAHLPPEAREEADRELDRLSRIPDVSPEYGIIRTYLEWLAALPWDKSSGGTIDVPKARQILDEDHYDIERVKDRILEYLAVRKFKESRAGEEPGEKMVEVGPEAEVLREPILCFVGPPGVGKTSLGQSIARAMGRKFIRMSLGGVRDEAEIRGHRRTYIGAMPGRIIQGIRRVGVNDPVMMLDEIDKLSVGFQGDPAAALLEVLDPAQNSSFVDNYVGVPFDLSHVLFITTANVRETIPPALLDRMEVIELPGYTEDEKVKIAERFLVPKQRRGHGLAEGEVILKEAAIRRIISDYTREAGVRNLERNLATVFRKAARQLAEGTPPPITVDANDIPSYLGPQRFFAETAERIDRAGIAIGLAWTPVGGQVMFIEATMMRSKENRLILTGMLGDVMKESAQAALSYIRSNARQLGVDPMIFDDKDIHIHVPAGAIPKDGPSAGITMAVTLASLVTARLARSDTAMTGEITLRGAVLPVGGIREKVMAAHRAGIKTVILPKRNETDLDELPEEVKREVKFVPVDSVDEVLQAALSEQKGSTPVEISPSSGRMVAKRHH